jgi:hypothetical protein
MYKKKGEVREDGVLVMKRVVFRDRCRYFVFMVNVMNMCSFLRDERR